MSSSVNEQMVRQANGAEQQSLSLIRALVVDDDKTVKNLVGRMLESLGYWTDSADGGVAAMRCIKQSSYRLVVSDFQMPDFDGYSLGGWLKHQSKQTKIIIMTGCAPPEVESYMSAGVIDGWLFKPFNLKNLRDLICELFHTDIPWLPNQRQIGASHR